MLRTFYKFLGVCLVWGAAVWSLSCTVPHDLATVLDESATVKSVEVEGEGEEFVVTPDQHGWLNWNWTTVAGGGSAIALVTLILLWMDRNNKRRAILSRKLIEALLIYARRGGKSVKRANPDKIFKGE